jgi:hypothetical protein
MRLFDLPKYRELDHKFLIFCVKWDGSDRCAANFKSKKILIILLNSARYGFIRGNFENESGSCCKTARIDRRRRYIRI